jgi:hypothetical protein
MKVTLQHPEATEERERAYYELKLKVPPRQQLQTLELLLTQFSSSDPFPHGFVDTVYFDTDRLEVHRLCCSEAPFKLKLRARGYREGIYTQLQIKSKQHGRVSKLKCAMRPCAGIFSGDTWQQLMTFCVRDDALARLDAISSQWGALRPCLRVRYERWRFRIGNDRVTLDTNIRLDAFPDEFPAALPRVQLEDAVLEIKSFGAAPRLPLLGIVTLRPKGLSKLREGFARLAVTQQGASRGPLGNTLRPRHAS